MVGEHDIEILEALLDGELSDGDTDALRTRLTSEPALSQAYEQLRGEREMRRHVWRGMEADDAGAAALISRVQSAVRRDELWTRRYRSLRYVSGLAACILVGFLFGRYLPGNVDSAARDRGTGIIFDGRGPIPEVRNTDPQAPLARADGYKVLLTDNYGRIIAEQRFESFDEAREFTEDLGRLQNRNRPVRVNDTVLIKGEF